MHGQSRYTRFKEARFAPIFAQSLRISKAPQVARFAYYHADLNAGSGFNDAAGVPGSPLNFLSAVTRNHRENFYAFFVDRKLEYVRQLIQRPEVEAFSDRVAIFQHDNSEVLPVVAQFIAHRERNPQFAVGSIVIDPNGYHDGVPWEALRDFCRFHLRIDLILNLNARQYRLEQSHIRAGRDPGWRKKRLQPISAFPEWFSRPNWMWTELCQIGGNRWIQLVGRTIRTHSAGYESLGFYDSQSERAQQILHDLEQPQQDVAERAPQLPLLFGL
jgi:hypothetical protein